MLAIIWGFKALKPHISTYPDFACENCKTKGTTDFYTYPQYIHVFWIPFFSGGKLFESHCKNCGYALTKQSLQKIPDHLKEIVKKEKKATKTPWYSFLGTYIVIAIFLGNVLFQVHTNFIRNNETQKYLSQPQINDFYVVKNDKTGEYTVWMLSDIDQNKLLFRSYGSDLYRPSDAEIIELNANQFNNFFNEKISLSKAEIESLKQKGDIYGIIRKK